MWLFHESSAVQIRNHAQVNPVNTGLFKRVLNYPTLAWRGKKYLVYKLLAGMLKQLVSNVPTTSPDVAVKSDLAPGNSMNPLKV